MGEWDDLFAETYLESFVPFLDEERTREEALDCPVGFGGTRSSSRRRATS